MLHRTHLNFPQEGAAYAVAELCDISIRRNFLSSILTKRENAPQHHAIRFRCKNVSLNYLREGDTPGAWSCSLCYNVNSIDRIREHDARSIFDGIIPMFEVIDASLPPSHSPVGGELTSDERASIQHELPLVRALSPTVQKRFESLLQFMVEQIFEVRKADQVFDENKDYTNRLRRQYTQLPKGTILVRKDRYYETAILTDEPGGQQNRQITCQSITGSGSVHTFSGKAAKNVRPEFGLVTPARVDRATPVLSMHETLKAVAQAEALAERFPDLA